ncbi:MAG: L-threonylcarbamoyladenylate synthase [Rikenellaceae bacterium]
MENVINQAVEVLRKGGLILYPTDTVWGVGCDATNREAVDRVYRLKGNTSKEAMLVLCKSSDMVLRYSSNIPSVALDVMDITDKPTTLILPNAVGVAKNLIPEARTIGVRVPDHEFCQRLLHKFGRAIVSTSANLSGEVTPLYFGDISSKIVDGVDYVVDKKCEGNPTRKPSAIISFNELGGVKIIRS